MFLYAKVVMDNLMAQGSPAELYEELQVKFPTGLDEAYVIPCIVQEPYSHTHVLDTNVSLSACSIVLRAPGGSGRQLPKFCVG